MTTDMMKLRSPNELLAVVPYLLGFHPSYSIVALCLRERRIGLVQRIDIPRRDYEQLTVSALLPALLADDPDTVIILGYESRSGDSIPGIEALCETLQATTINVHDRLVICDGRWSSLDCTNPGCCPPGGSALPEPSEVSRVTAEFIGRGIAPHADRESLAHQVEAGPQAVAVAEVLHARQKGADTAAVSATALRAELFAAWPRILDPEAKAITSEEATSAALSLLDIEVRDGLIATLCPGTLKIDELSQEVKDLFRGLEPDVGDTRVDSSSRAAHSGVKEALIRLCAMLPDEAAAPSLSVLGCYVWWLGDGALARVALARALRGEPGYRLAQLLLQMVDLAIRPGDH